MRSEDEFENKMAGQPARDRALVDDEIRAAAASQAVEAQPIDPAIAANPKSAEQVELEAELAQLRETAPALRARIEARTQELRSRANNRLLSAEFDREVMRLSADLAAAEERETAVRIRLTTLRRKRSERIARAQQEASDAIVSAKRARRESDALRRRHSGLSGLLRRAIGAQTE